MTRAFWFQQSTTSRGAGTRPGRRTIGLAAAVIVSVALLAAGLVQTAMLGAFRGLPAEVLDQNRDISVMIAEFGELVGAIDAARLDPSPDRLAQFRTHLDAASDQAARLRLSYNFDNLIGASAMHALVNPALQDIRRWSTEGASGLQAAGPAVLELSLRRASDVYVQLRRLYEQSHQSSRALLIEQETGLERFRLLLALISGFSAAIMLALGGLLIRQRRISAQVERTAHELAVARDAAELANRAKSDFLAKMSHELRTPLNAIIGFAEILKDQLHGPINEPKYLEYVGDIHDSGEHLLAIINDILDLSKVEAGRFDLTFETVSVDEVVRSATRLVEPRITRSGVAFGYRAPSPLPALVVDRRALRQILINILGNAAKFTEHGSIMLEADRAPDGGFVFVIRDTGIGMSRDEIVTALTPFGQVETVITRRYEGTGLGLPLAKALVELHGGTLSIDSTPGLGTAVTIALPSHCVVPSVGAMGPSRVAVKV